MNGSLPINNTTPHSVKMVDSVRVGRTQPSRADDFYIDKPRPNIELALFFDAAAYNQYKDFFNGDDTEIRNMLLAYVNQMQVLYR